MRRLILAALLALGGAATRAETPGDFDYYVLALSWTPNWCAREGDARGADQCHPRHDHGWTLHGLWPQYARGWPDFCPTTERPPSRAMTAGMSDIMGSAGLAWHQWKKHGSCSGLSAEAYFALSRQAYETVTRPEVFRRLDRTVRLPAEVVEEAFLKANPDLRDEMLTVTCKAGMVAEIRLCLNRALAPIPCGADISRDCTLERAVFHPAR